MAGFETTFYTLFPTKQLSALRKDFLNKEGNLEAIF
jgi:hypothetical protein